MDFPTRRVTSHPADVTPNRERRKENTKKKCFEPPAVYAILNISGALNQDKTRKRSLNERRRHRVWSVLEV